MFQLQDKVLKKNLILSQSAQTTSNLKQYFKNIS